MHPVKTACFHILRTPGVIPAVRAENGLVHPVKAACVMLDAGENCSVISPVDNVTVHLSSKICGFTGKRYLTYLPRLVLLPMLSKV